VAAGAARILRPIAAMEVRSDNGGGGGASLGHKRQRTSRRSAAPLSWRPSPMHDSAEAQLAAVGLGRRGHGVAREREPSRMQWTKALAVAVILSYPV
jgi:hypothetical protein